MNGWLRSAAVTLLFAVTALLVPPVQAASPVSSEVVNLVNAERSRTGAPRLSSLGGLTSVAQRWADTMAGAERIWHSPDTGTQIPTGWSRWGENIAFTSSPTASKLHTALINSPRHHQNIVDPSFTHVGVGYATDSAGNGYITQVFASYAGTSSPGPSPARPEPAPQPKVTTPPPAAKSSGAQLSSGQAPQATHPAPTTVPAPVPAPKKEQAPEPGPATEEPAVEPETALTLEAETEDETAELPAGWVGPSSGHGDIIALQENLAYLDAGVAADGHYGPATIAAVTTFRNMHGLPAADVADPDMLARLERSVSRRTMMSTPTPAKEAPTPPGAGQEAPAAPLGAHGPVQRPEPVHGAAEAPVTQGRLVGLGLVGAGIAVAIIFTWLQVTTTAQQASNDRAFQRLRGWFYS